MNGLLSTIRRARRALIPPASSPAIVSAEPAPPVPLVVPEAVKIKPVAPKKSREDVLKK